MWVSQTEFPGMRSLYWVPKKEINHEYKQSKLVEHIAAVQIFSWNELGPPQQNSALRFYVRQSSCSSAHMQYVSIHIHRTSKQKTAHSNVRTMLLALLTVVPKSGSYLVTKYSHGKQLEIAHHWEAARDQWTHWLGKQSAQWDAKQRLTLVTLGGSDSDCFDLYLVFWIRDQQQ